MGKSTTEETETTTVIRKPGGVLKKVSATYQKLADKPVGYAFEGEFITLNETEHVDAEGEVTKRYTLIIADTKGERTKFLADAGLRSALADAMVTKGDWFKAVKGEKVTISNKRTMNQWDIFQYTQEN